MCARSRIFEKLMAVFTWAAAILTLGTLAFLVGFILIKGIPHLKPSLFSFTYNSVNVSLMPAMVSTVMMTLLSLLIAAPLGIFSAIFLVEYAKRGSKVVRMIRMTTETLAGIPSIVYGLFGLLFFVTFLGWGFSLLAGAFTLAIMILPLIMRSSERLLRLCRIPIERERLGWGPANCVRFFELFCLLQHRGYWQELSSPLGESWVKLRR